MTRQDLARVVKDNDKQRFEWDRDTDRVRARQGHSVDVDLGLVPVTPPEVLFHGTPRRDVESVLATGLDRRGRHHVHLSVDLATAHRVGARRGDHVVLEVQAGRMARDGFTFYRSSNGVWLTDEVPPKYLSQLR
jgi:putative RNA 2'-phosphotransferase